MARRLSLNNGLEKLHYNLLKVGSLVEEAIYFSVSSVVDRNIVLAEKVFSRDNMIAELCHNIEQDCFHLIALQQPMASDLRRIATVLKVVTDLERMAEYSLNIAKSAIRLRGETYMKPLVDIARMGKLTQMMVRNALTAYIEQDKEMCYQLSIDDHLVDHLYKDIHQQLNQIMLKDQETVFQGTEFLFVAHYLERIADHATNLGEWVIYLISGKLVELND